MGYDYQKVMKSKRFLLQKGLLWKTGVTAVSAIQLCHLPSARAEPEKKWRGILSNSDTSADSTTIESRFILPSVDTRYQEPTFTLCSPLIS